MQHIERKIGKFLYERRNERQINNMLNTIESLSYDGVSVQSPQIRDSQRKFFRGRYRNVATLYSGGDPQTHLQVIECFRDLFMDLKEKGLITQAKQFSPVELLKLSTNDTLDDRPKLKSLLDEMMEIKKRGGSFEVSNLFIHSVDLSSSSIGYLAKDLGPSEFDTYTQIRGESIEPKNVPQSVNEVGKTHMHVHEVKDVTPPEEKSNIYQHGSGYDPGYTPVYEHKVTHLRNAIFGRIVPKNNSS